MTGREQIFYASEMGYPMDIKRQAASQTSRLVDWQLGDRLIAQ